jgi:hypothetical protein
MFTVEVTVLRTGTEMGGKVGVSGERNGFMVEVGWVGQEQERYEVVGKLPDY